MLPRKHRFKSEHDIEKALRRAQLEVNDWEAFVRTASDRLERKYVRPSSVAVQKCLCLGGWRANVVYAVRVLLPAGKRGPA